MELSTQILQLMTFTFFLVFVFQKVNVILKLISAVMKMHKTIVSIGLLVPRKIYNW